MTAMNTNLHLYYGLPGSGKSTLAAKRASETGSVIVNRDDLRLEVAGPRYSRPIGKVEKVVSELQKERLTEALRRGDAICDDTNLNVKTVQALLRLAKNVGATVTAEPVDVPLEVALARNKARGAAGGRLVPEEVIRGMANRAYRDGVLKELLLDTVNDRAYMVPRLTAGMKILAEANTRLEAKYPITGDRVVLVDCDGTLANNAHHAAYAFARPGEKDYKFFYESITDAPVNTAVRDLVNLYAGSGYPCFMLTGRSDEAAAQLAAFVEGSGAKISRIIAKRAGDFRPDFVSKAETLKSLREQGLTVVAAIDDRPQSIRVWDQNGIHVDRVNYIELDYDPENEGPREEPFVNTPHIGKIEEQYLA